MFGQTFADIYAKVLRDDSIINIAQKPEIKKTYLEHRKLHYLNSNLKIFKKIPGEILEIGLRAPVLCIHCYTPRRELSLRAITNYKLCS